MVYRDIEECGVSGLRIQKFRMRGTGNLPKSKEFILQFFLLYEGHILFLGVPSTSCVKNSIPEKVIYIAQKGIGT